jgi:uncharacterized membrane protein
MFQFLFKYPPSVFEKGKLVFLASWPVWLLILAMAVAGGVFGWLIWSRGRKASKRGIAVWLLQTGLVALILLLLWRPALSVATLAPQQNVVAVVVDDSRSMGVSEDGKTRRDRVNALLDGGMLSDLRKRFQVRLYRLGSSMERIDATSALTAQAPSTHIGTSLARMLADSSGLPLGAVVLLSDGSDNSGGIDYTTMAAIRGRRIPIHTIGFGETTLRKDVEIDDAQVPSSAMAGSRLEAVVTLRENGFRGGKTRLSIRRNGQVLAARDVVFREDNQLQTERVLFNAGEQGVSDLEIAADPLPGETNPANNRLTRVLTVDGAKRRILYVEGEPRWEYKFLRRAVEDDPNLQITSMLRTTPNKIYRQGLSDPKELEQGFPSKVEELFAYQGLVIGSVEAGYFTQEQRDLIREFVDRRGGGLLMLAGRSALSDGGYDATPFPDLLPVTLPHHAGTFKRDPANVQLTPAGRDSLICRLEEDPGANVTRWKNLPYLANYQDVGAPKPGALVLAEMTTGSAKLPLLVTENYGRGRTAVFATAGSWRWQMLQPVSDMSQETFWRQMLRWLAAATPSRVTASTPVPVIDDDNKVSIRAEVRDTTYLPASDAEVRVHVTGPAGYESSAALSPDPNHPGIYAVDIDAAKAGSYVAEVVASRGHDELGRGAVAFRREDGRAENFHQEQNRELLEKLASETGGRYYSASDAGHLATDITFSDAGISVRETHDLWDMPAAFLLALLLRSTEWLLRRRWGVV